MTRKPFDAAVVGAGPNGLAAALALQATGRSVVLYESRGRVGGGLWTDELTLPGFHHDICSAIHPMGISSPYMQTLELEAHGWIPQREQELRRGHPLALGVLCKE